MPEQDAQTAPRGAARIPVGLRYMAAAAFFFSVMSLLVKVAGQRLPTQEVVLARSSVGAFLSWVVLRSRGVSILGNRKGLLMVRALLGYGALSCFFYALVRLPLADATVIQYTNPVFTALIAAALLAEHVRPREVVLALASLGGVVLVARPTLIFGAGPEALDPVAVAVAVTGAVFSAGAYVTVRRLGGTEDAMVIVFYFAAVSVLLSLPMVVPNYVHPEGREWLLLLGVGVSTHLGQVFLTWGLQRERAGRAMAVGYLQIVFATLWGIWIFSEIPDGWSVLGALVIVASTFLIARGGEEAGAYRRRA